jgi:hypothetical protein
MQFDVERAGADATAVHGAQHQLMFRLASSFSHLLVVKSRDVYPSRNEGVIIVAAELVGIAKRRRLRGRRATIAPLPLNSVFLLLDHGHGAFRRG